ncbi:MAG: tetratricopeptide repeat protein [Magnetococcales bacterium]|nr:tetratricopeptide repeat protein [Magnetococcales bacterium]
MHDENRQETGRQVTLKEALEMAVQHHRAGELNQAETLYRQILNADPRQADALHLLGVIAHQAEQLDQAERLMKQALESQPDMIGVNGNLGGVYWDRGLLDAAIRCYEAELCLQPNDMGMLNNLAVALTQQERAEEALVHIEHALKIEPDNFSAHINHGKALKAVGDYSAAELAFLEGAKIQTESAELYNNLGQLFQEQSILDRALECYQKALDLDDGDHPDPHNNLGTVLVAMGRPEEAVAHYQHALDMRPNDVMILRNIGHAFRDTGNMEEAISSYRAALERHPGNADIHNDLGAIYVEMGRYDDAEPLYRAGLMLNPRHTDMMSNLGLLMVELGRTGEAVACYQKALTHNPTPHVVKSLLGSLLYLPDMNPIVLFDAFRRHMAHTLPEQSPLTPNPEPHPKRLRIGYLSSDLCDHPVGHNVGPLMEHHDAERFEVFCYAETTREDAISARFQEHCHHWLEIGHLNDRQIAERIHSDGIHIMVYLAGLFDNNRLLVAAHRPAPVQVSFHSGATTTLQQMDYWLTDGVLHPEEATLERFSERLFRLPMFYNYPIPDHAPPISPLPADEKGHIGFISLNNPSKVNDAVVDLWSSILRRIPDATLTLKYRNRYETTSLRARLGKAFKQRGIDTRRILFLSALDQLDEHLALYDQADIALDPFPFSGATTTFQALWMGVPVISLLGDNFCGRMAADILVHTGLEELTAKDKSSYINLAVTLANDRNRLRKLRASIRKQVMASPICDGKGYAQSMEKAYEEMWKKRILGQVPE